MSCGKAHWELLVESAEALTGAGRAPFSRDDLIRYVHRTHPDVKPSSLHPVIQGLTANAPGGPRSACGTPLWRVDRNQYVLRATGSSAEGGEADAGVSSARAGPGDRRLTRWGPQRRRLVDPRVDELVGDFDRCVAVYDEEVPFRRSGQYRQHRNTIDWRNRFASVAAALDDGAFLLQLRHVLQRWGIGRRASKLAGLRDFRVALRARPEEISSLDGLSIERLGDDLEGVVPVLWQLVDELDIVENNARIVAGTKTLHHLLPDLVPPMDRAWTGTFFGWTPHDAQYDQQRTFTETYRRFARVAGEVRPSRLVGPGWRTSPSKILDNAVIGFCKSRGLDVPGGAGRS